MKDNTVMCVWLVGLSFLCIVGIICERRPSKAQTAIVSTNTVTFTNQDTLDLYLEGPFVTIPNGIELNQFYTVEGIRLGYNGAMMGLSIDEVYADAKEILNRRGITNTAIEKLVKPRAEDLH